MRTTITWPEGRAALLMTGAITLALAACGSSGSSGSGSGSTSGPITIGDLVILGVGEAKGATLA